MSDPKVQPPNPQQVMQDRMIALANQKKAPLRQAFSQMEEIALAEINQCAQNQVILETQIESLNQEIMKLRKLCEDNKIDWKPKANSTVEPVVSN